MIASHCGYCVAIAIKDRKGVVMHGAKGSTAGAAAADSAAGALVATTPTVPVTRRAGFQVEQSHTDNVGHV
jgi:hypothetical protein